VGNYYGNSQSCVISVLGNVGAITVEAFSTESGYDKLTVNGMAYSGSAGPQGVTPTPSVNITWLSDGSVTKAGWKICTVIR
jgi:hypothetical protein